MLLGNQGGTSPKMDINVNLKDSETIGCTNCDGKLFDTLHILKRVPKVIIGAPTDVPIPVPIWTCVSCGEVMKEFIPRAVGTFDDIFGTSEEV